MFCSVLPNETKSIIHYTKCDKVRDEERRHIDEITATVFELTNRRRQARIGRRTDVDKRRAGVT